MMRAGGLDMRKILFVVALAGSAVGVRSLRAEAGCGGGGACGMGAVKVTAKAKAGLQVPYVAPKQGEVATVADEESMNGTLSIDGKATPMTQAMKQSYAEEIVAVEG